MKEELKACPFCGGPPFLRKTIDMKPAWEGDYDPEKASSGTYYRYKCYDCGMEAPWNYPTKEQAIEAWNTRENHEN